jgi:hypothetical protein
LRLETQKRADGESKQRRVREGGRRSWVVERNRGCRLAEAHAREVDLDGPFGFATEPVAVGVEALVPEAACAVEDELVDEGECCDCCRNFLVIDVELNGLG